MSYILFTIPVQNGGIEVTTDTILAIIAVIIAVFFGILALRADRRSEKLLSGITQNQIYEKTAMLHGYLPVVRKWEAHREDSEYIESETSRIEADIFALGEIAEIATKEQKKAIRSASTVLLDKMRASGFTTQASRLQAAFDSIKL